MLRRKIKNNIKSSFFPAESLSMLANDMHIIGDVEATHDMRIDCHIDGNVRCKAKVVIGPAAILNGDLYAENADIFGTVKGDLYISGLLSLRSKCHINGDLTVGRLDIEPDAGFNGKCTMKGETATATSAKVVPTANLKLQEQY